MADDPDSPFAVASGELMLFMTQIARGGVVFSSDLAAKLAELLCQAHFGDEELIRQQPLSVSDRDSYWRVEGSFNRDGKVEGPGVFFVSVSKRDGRVTDFGRLYPYHAHPSVVPMIRQRLKRIKSGDTE
jgi:hypothetical protein